jgi:hypothetical protein
MHFSYNRREFLQNSLALSLAGQITAKGATRFFQKGVNFTAEFPGGYGSGQATDILAELPKYHVNAIAMVPYGFNRLGTTAIRFGGGHTMEREDGIERLSTQAHSLGMKVMLKPQVWTGRGFPGDIDFTSAEDAKQWFAAYGLFVEFYAELARKIRADIFCVGVEFGKLVKYEREWRALIARARRIYKGPLTYAANSGPEFETLAFWDALDYIGLNNYYPLPDDLSTDKVVGIVETVQKKFRKPVIFPEAGYCSYEAPHRAPWDESPRKLALEDQARCYEALFKAFWAKPWFAGVYWWKVGTNGFGGATDGSHTPWRKPAMDVMARWYAKR